MELARIDHVVLTADNIDQALRWYVDVLGMEAVTLKMIAERSPLATRRSICTK